jgi:hypothetical protein
MWHTSFTVKFSTSIKNQSNICQLWDLFLIIEKGLEQLKYLFKIKNISMYSLLSTCVFFYHFSIRALPHCE